MRRPLKSILPALEGETIHSVVVAQNIGFENWGKPDTSEVGRLVRLPHPRIYHMYMALRVWEDVSDVHSNFVLRPASASAKTGQEAKRCCLGAAGTIH